MEHEGRCVGNHVNAYTSDMDFHGGSKLSKLTYPIKTIYSKEARVQLRKVLDEEFAFKWLMSVMVFFPLLWIGSTFANSDELVWILIYIVTAKNVEPESIARTIRAVCGFGMCVIVLSALIGIIPNNYELAINEAGKVTIRMYMGFIHCNVFGSFLSTIFLCHFFIRFNRLNKFDYLFGLLLTTVCAFVAYSRTNAIIMLIALLSIKYFVVPVKSRLRIALFVMIFFAVASVALCRTISRCL